MANMAQLVNVIAPIFTSDQGMYLQTIFYPLQLFALNAKGKSLELFVDCSKYKTPRFDEVPHIDASAAYDNGSLVLNVVNRHKTEAIEVDIDLEDKQFSGPVAVSQVNGPDIKSENDFGKTTVKTAESTVTAEQRRLRHSFPAHSFTQLKVKLV